jgi:uncharacterized protein involved in exopolysaccharide biosynthesis
MASFRPRTLPELFNLFRRRKFLILFSALVVLISALIVVFNIPRVYESRTLIVVSGLDYEMQTSGSLIAAVTEQAMSRSNLEAIIQRYSLENYQPGSKIDPLIESLRKQIKVVPKYRIDYDGFPESFAISYRHSDPATAQKVVTDVVSLFEKANETMAKHAADEARALANEIAGIESQLAQAGRTRRASAARSSAAGRAIGNLDRIRAERQAVTSSLETLGDRQYMLERQISDQRRLVAQQRQIAGSAPPSEGRGGVYASLLKRKSDLETQLQSFSAQYTDKNPRVVETREQLSEVNSRIAQLNAAGEQTRAAASSPEAQELRTMERELTRLETELDIVRREIGRKKQAASGLPAGGLSAPISTPSAASFEPAGTEMESETLRTRYDSLLERQNALQKVLPSAGSVAPPLFQVVDPPNLPQTIAAPNRRLLIIVSLVLALVASFVVVGSLESRRFSSFHDERDVDYFLGVPVVALLPEALTPAERFQANRIQQKRRLKVLLVGAAAVPALAFVLDNLGLFQFLATR